MTKTRGERNNNPGNIKISGNAWQGKVAGSDPVFESFIDPVYGLRAIAVNLHSYQRAGYATVRQMVSRYSATDQASYIANVARALGVAPDDPVDLSSDAIMAKMVEAIVRQENGRVIYSADQINQAVRAAV